MVGAICFGLGTLFGFSIAAMVRVAGESDGGKDDE